MYTNFWLKWHDDVVLAGYVSDKDMAARMARSYVRAAQAEAKKKGKVLYKKDFSLIFKG